MTKVDYQEITGQFGEPVHIWQFPRSHASMVHHLRYRPTGGEIPLRLQVERVDFQVIDEYGYQRELAIQDVGDGKWNVVAYLHPWHGQEGITTITRDQARRLIDHFIYLANEYPSLLFNERDEGENVRRPVCGGFVHFHQALVMHADASVRLLKRYA